MKPDLSVFTKTPASRNLRRPLAAFVTLVALTMSALSAGCSATRCHCQRSCAHPHEATCQAVASPSCGAADANDAHDAADVTMDGILPNDADISDVTVDPILPPTPVTSPVVVPAKPLDSSGITPRSRPEYGHADDYRWLIGRLQRVHVPRDGWKIRYAPLDQQDRWGGSVVLTTDVRLDEFEEGDIVFVEGEILGDRASLYLAGPRYRLRNIRLVSEEDFHRVARRKN